MPSYANGRVYAVLNTLNDKKYIGSTTCPLSKRMGEHRLAAAKGNGRPLYVAMRELGVDKFYIELVKDCPCERREQLRREEGQAIREMNTTVPNGYNSRIAGRTAVEYTREYYAANKDLVCEKKREWNQANKPIQKQRNHAYKEAHKEELKIQRKEYYEANKGAMKAKRRVYEAANRATISEKARMRAQRRREAATAPTQT